MSEPISVAYQKFLKEAKKKLGRNWMDYLPEELRPALLAVHQAAITDYWKRRKLVDKRYRCVCHNFQGDHEQECSDFNKIAPLKRKHD